MNPTSRIRRWLLARWGWLLVALAAALAVLAELSAVARVDLLLYDGLEALTAPARAPAAQAVIVAIDERSIAALGRWPWDRDLHGQLLDRLTDAGAAAVGMSILFTEPGSGDHRLAAALARSGRVILPVAPAEADDGDGVRALLPLPGLAAGAAALGHVDVELDADALARRTFRQAGVGGAGWPALSLAVAETVQAERPPTPGADAPAHASAHQWVRAGEMLLPYPRPGDTPPVYSYIDILRDPALAAGLAGKAVFVGAVAAGLDAGLATPGTANGRPMPAVEFHARAYEALMSGRVHHTASTTLTLSATLLLLLPAMVFRPTRRALRIPLATGGLLLPFAASGVLLREAQVWVPPAAATGGLIAGHLLTLVLRLVETRRHLKRAHRQADATLRSIADGVISVDGKGAIVFMNPVAGRLLGASLAELGGQPVGPLLGRFTAEASRLGQLLRRCLTDGRQVTLPAPLAWTSADGARHMLTLTLTPIASDEGGAVLAFHDVTESVASTQRLRHEATHDPLTGLPNRSLLLDRLQRAIARSTRSGSMVAVLFIDLDRFKRINDSLGHHCGDLVLQNVARRLTAAVRTEDTVARWGGDEFIVLLDGLADRHSVATIATKILELLDREIEGMDVHGLSLACSIGISLGPQDSTDADALLSMADKAMYRGKEDGGRRFTFYAAEMNTWSRDRLSIESALRGALANGEFELFYQPQVSITGRRLVGFESLIRWRRPGVGLVPPDQFIPAAEESGHIRAMGEWVVREAAAQLARWSAEGLPLVPVAVNVSSRQCADMAIVDTIRHALAESRLAPQLLKIELTESTAMHKPDFVAELLARVAELGVGVSVDDFGTGYSSLSHLKRFPVSELKIDRSFVAGITHAGDDAAIVQGTIALAHGLGKSVVAEGVETAEQLEFLTRLGCDTAQGWLFSRPLPAAEVRARLARAPLD